MRLASFFKGPKGFGSPRRMFWVALVARLLVITIGHTYRMRALMDHFQFGWEMGRIARALATGQGFANPFNAPSGPTAWTPPLYPLILGGVFKLFGVYTLKSGWVILAINSVLSAAAAPAVYEMAWRCFGRDREGRVNPEGMKVALWSGWLWALYPAAMQYAVHWVWDMSLTVALFAWTLVFALRVRGIGDPVEQAERGGFQTARYWAIFGILWGLVGLSNSSLFTFLPFCGVWMVWPELKPRLALALRNATLSAACCAVVLSPWIVRNWLVFHAFIPMRSTMGAELYQSVLPSNQGFPWGPTLPMAPSDPRFQQYLRMGEVAYAKHQGQLARPIIRANKLRLVGYVLRRIDFFWVSVPHPVDKSLFTEVVRESNYAFLSLAALLGLALALHRRQPAAWLFFWAFLTIPLIYYLITVQARFRHPLEPIMTILIVYLFQSAERPHPHRQHAHAQGERP